MPYDIRKRGDEYCVIKRDNGESMGCHSSREKAVRQLSAIEASENKALTIFKDEAGARHMLIVTSNSYPDREDQTIETRALEDYVESQWKDGTWAGDNVVLFWHDGPAIGDIVHADMEGPFLVEVAKERTSGLPVIQAYTTAIWDYIESGREEEWGASHGFAYRASDLVPDDGRGTFRSIQKFETSVLPRKYAANALTYSGVLQMDEKRQEKLEQIGAAGWTDKLRAVLGITRQDLDEAGVQHKAIGPQVTKQDLVDVVSYTVKAVMERYATKEEGDDEPLVIEVVAAEVLDTMMEVPATNVADYDLGQNDNDEEPDGVTIVSDTEDSKERRIVYEVNNAQAKLFDALVTDSAALVSAQAETNKALGVIAEGLAEFGTLAQAVKATNARLAKIEKQLDDRPRRAAGPENTYAEEDLPENIKAAQEAAEGPRKLFDKYPLS